MSGYKHPCRYCGKLVSSGSNVCPYCGKIRPLESLRCPRCREPIDKDYIKCPNCGLDLKIECPHCKKKTFFGDYCEHCDARLVVICPNKKCKAEQPPIGDKCVKCGKSLKGDK